jgi:predicted DNA-binding protein
MIKKDSVYSIRMSSLVRDALKRAARKERRTVASLLDKIILDYLEKEGLILASDIGAERRRFQRKKISLPAVSLVRLDENTTAQLPCVILDISMGGVLLAYPKGGEIPVASMGELPRFEVSFRLPKSEEQLRFLCDARRMVDHSSEIHVGAMFSGFNEESKNQLQTYLT